MSEHDEHVEDEVEAHHHHRNLANDEGAPEGEGEDFELHHHKRNLANDEGSEGEGDDFELHHRRTLHHKRNL